jgi:hypothetical protein
VFAAIINHKYSNGHTSTRCNVNNTIDNSKYLRSDIIHKEEDPDTRRMQIWNDQQMDPIDIIRAATKCSR